MELPLIALVVVVLAIGWWLWRKRTQTSAPVADDSRGKARPKQREALDTVLSWQPQATRVLTTSERKVYNSLRLSLPEHIVLAQVPLARFLKVPTRYSYSEWLRRVGLMCADLVVCDSNSQVVAVIDIRPPEGQENERAKQRNQRMDRVIRGADIPMHIWRENALPTGLAARNAILQLPADTPADHVPAKAKPSAVPVLDQGLSFEPPSDDDVVEPGEPPPSTWFDDLDSAPVPLSPTPSTAAGKRR